MNWPADDNEEYYAETKKPNRNPVFHEETLRKRVELAVDPYFSSRAGAKFDCVNDVMQLITYEKKRYAANEMIKLESGCAVIGTAYGEPCNVVTVKAILMTADYLIGLDIPNN